jgi:mono/diheme cytochrome c family protein
MSPGCIDRLRFRALILICTFIPSASVPAGESGASRRLEDAAAVAAWQTLRIVDCARCHGKGYEGLVAPSIVNYARTQDRDAFVRMVLDGDSPRGMPGYRTNGLVAERIDDIYRYFLGRASGEIDADSRP